jgi:hypothetical protein
VVATLERLVAQRWRTAVYPNGQRTRDDRLDPEGLVPPSRPRHHLH